MPDWLHDLPVLWLAAIVIGVAVLITATIYVVVISLSTGERGRAFASISPGLLPPMGIVFALLVGFLAAQVWSTGDRAAAAVSEEASALRAVVLLSSEFPGEPEARMRRLIDRHIKDAVTKEWPQMAEQGATLSAVPAPLADLQAMALGLRPESPGQTIAQQEIITSLGQALDARRQRIIVSESSVSSAKWGAVATLAILTLFAIAFVHSGNRRGAAIAMALFASAAVAAIIMIAAQERPFAGDFAVSPTPLEQVDPTLPP
jgi:multisubunit Na+/H+ antiporter MnhC subunit